MPSPSPFAHGDALRERITDNLAVGEQLDDERAAGARPRSDRPIREAAVAITLLPQPDGSSAFPVIMRTSSLRNHAGQFGLPGGRLDAGELPEQAARRELHEELGVALPATAVIGRLAATVTTSGYRIHPIVCFAPAAVRLRPDPGEVAEHYLVGVDELDEAVTRADGHEALLVLGTVIFAPTGEILRRFRELGLHGRQPGPGWPEPRFTWR